MSNPIGWVEIPVTDMARAITFYNTVFGWSLVSKPYGTAEMAMFPNDSGAPGTSGALVYETSFYTPSLTDGPLVYFTCTDCQLMDEKTERAGGRILVPKKPFAAGRGYVSVVEDSEGNRIAFRSMF